MNLHAVREDLGEIHAQHIINNDVVVQRFDLAQLGPLSNVRMKASGFYREIDESIVWILINPRTIAPVNTGSALTVY